MGLETPVERSDLYEDFDIHHDRVSTQGIGGEGTINMCEEGMRSMETQRTMSDKGSSSRALIPETGIEKRAFH